MAKTDSDRWRVHGLPTEVTGFVGRRCEMADVKRMLSKGRLVTLTGVAGVGKTRLAHRVAVGVRRAFPDGVWLVELAGLENPDLLVNTIAVALDMRDQSSHAAVEALISHLRERTTLIVLDNCEHLLNECAILADTILRNAPLVRILATSRQVLGIVGEQVLAVPVMSLPDSGTEWLSTEQFAQFDAIRLFTERAQAVLPGFAVTADNRHAVEGICRRLDGIPLAIELAAVRLRVLSLDQLLDRIDDRFRLLDSGSHAMLPRHRTLRALIDWSYALCTPRERLLWARISVFSGGIDLEAVEEVCSGDGIAREEILDLVAAMVNKSVLLREEHPLGMRYRLLGTMRQYGRERLAESGEEAGLRRRHREFYRQRCAETQEQIFGPSQVASLTRLEVDNAELRSAIDYCFTTPGEAASGLRMATDLVYHWITGDLREGRRRLEQGLATDHEPNRFRARSLVVTTWLAVVQGDLDAADAMLGEAQAIGERLNDERVLADVALHRALLAVNQGAADAAIELCERALAGQLRAGDPADQALVYLLLTAARVLRNDLGEAVRVAEEGIALCDAHEEGYHQAYLRTILGIARWRQGDVRGAADLARESLAFHRLLDDPRGIAVNLSLLACTSATEGRYEKAGRLLGILRIFSSDPRSRRAIGGPVAGRPLARYQDRCEAQIREAMGAAGLEAALNWGARLSAGEALCYALREDLPGEETTGERSASLTQREREIARLVARGMSNRQIAAELLISQRTAEGHVEHILNKLSVSSRIKISAWVRQQDDEVGRGVLPA